MGKNRKVEIYYYEVLSDEKPNLEKSKLTENEKEGNFSLRYINLDDVESEIKRNVKQSGDKQGISDEMIQILKIYKDIKSVVKTEKGSK